MRGTDGGTDGGEEGGRGGGGGKTVFMCVFIRSDTAGREELGRDSGRQDWRQGAGSEGCGGRR